MLIDWFTVAAQIINFLILVALLKWLLYDRIIAAMDRREQSIDDRFQEAAQQRQQAEDKEAEYRRKNQAMDERRDELMRNLKQETEKKRKELTAEVHQEVDDLRARWLRSLRDEKAQFAREFARRSVQRVLAVSRRSLQDLAGADLEERALDMFLARLGQLPEDKRQQLARAVAQDDAGATLRTAFELSGEARQKTDKALHDALGTSFAIDYATDSNLVLGMELKVAGQKVAWNAAGYLESLETHAREVLEQEAGEAASQASSASNDASDGEDDNRQTADPARA